MRNHIAPRTLHTAPATGLFTARNALAYRHSHNLSKPATHAFQASKPTF